MVNTHTRIDVYTYIYTNINHHRTGEKIPMLEIHQCKDYEQNEINSIYPG